MESNRATLTAFIVSSVLAGGNAVGVVFTVRELDPLWGAAIRFTAAAIILLGVVVVLRLRLPQGRNLGRAAVFGRSTSQLPLRSSTTPSRRWTPATARSSSPSSRC